MHANKPDHADGIGGAQGAVPLGDNSEVSEIVADARGRADGFVYGDDRAIGARPNWAAADSHQLYRYATVNNDPSSAEEVGQGWTGHSRDLQQAADDLYNAISELGAAWVGQGAGAAQGSLVAIANSGTQASEAAKTMSVRLGQQAAAAAKLKTMPEPREFDPAAETAAMLAGGPAAMVSDMKPQFDAAREVKAQQVACLEAYTAALAEIDSTTPSFGPESLGLKPLGSGVSVNAARVGGVGSYAGAGGAAHGGFLAGIGASPPVVTHGADLAAPAGHGGDAATAGPAPAPGHGMAAASGSGSVAPVPPASSGGPGIAPSLGAAAAGGALGFAGARALSSGNRSGSTKQQSSETTASANQQNGPAVPAQQGQGPSVVSPSGTVGSGPVPPHASGVPMGGMGGAAGQGDDDKEHKHASFLIEPDPDATFGAAEAAAPPVLGAWDPDDEER